MTIPLHWWYLPVALALYGCWQGFYKATINPTRKGGYLEGLDHWLLACACWLAAVVSVVTGLLR